ncbi:MAG: serine/threonine-protein kinase [Betaproteobacteria bacterium]|nr:serine/threonine-protein kinase [Betaproteobacteria bacterium]
MPSTDQPRRFGRYTVLGEIGRGAMGTVYRAADPALERQVAVKTLHPNLPAEILAEVRERFLREAKAAGRLNHANIVTIYDVGEQDGIAYMAMELLEGRTLEQMLRDPARLPFATIADVVAQVADALDHAHRAGIVHRDVKPANIVVSATGRAKLADFGIAHLASSSMTQTGSALGSPKYMSPEQVLGQPIDARSDIFSLGVVLYEMLTRRTPFERAGDTTVFAMLGRIPVEKHEPASSIDPGIPAGFDRILARALAKSPAERYQRASDLANDLRTDPSLRGGDDRTVILPLPARSAARDAEFERSSLDLIADVDEFAKSFEERQREILRTEEQAQLRKEEELRLWGEEQERRRQEFERQREAEDHSRTLSQRMTAIELLRERAARDKAGDDRAKRIEIAAKVDGRLRVAFRYLSELATELNRVKPVSAKPYLLMYLGEVAGVILSDGFTDYRSREMDAKERIDFITFRYKASSPQPVSVDVGGRELRRTLDRLSELHIPYKCTNYRKNEFGTIALATLKMSGPFPCQLTLRGDYDDPGFVLDLMNVRRNGPERLRFALEEFTDHVLDEFGNYLLGADDAFAQRLPARGPAP